MPPDNRLFQEQVESAAGERAAPSPSGRGSSVPADLAHRREGGACAAPVSGVAFSNESLAPADLRRLRVEAFPPHVASLAAGGGAGTAGSR
jgi:hypothetical protein